MTLFRRFRVGREKRFDTVHRKLKLLFLLTQLHGHLLQPLGHFGQNLGADVAIRSCDLGLDSHAVGIGQAQDPDPNSKAAQRPKSAIVDLEAPLSVNCSSFQHIDLTRSFSWRNILYRLVGSDHGRKVDVKEAHKRFKIAA